jgi:hypothetical protein
MQGQEEALLQLVEHKEMQILRLLPDQIMEHWHFIKDSMERSFPPVAEATPEAFLELQQSFLLGEMDCWFAVTSIDTEDIIAVMTTKVVMEDVTKTRNMLIFSVTTYQLHSEDLWTDGYNALRKYAAGKGCNKIISFTDNPNVLRIASQLGADVNWSLIQLEV